MKLSKRLDQSYQIILVGLTQEQIQKVPKNIIGIERTDSVQELVELYSAADVFVNPTLEDNYPTTNLEAIACGTPVITYNTGGSPESARMYGLDIKKGDIEQLKRNIQNVKQIKKKTVEIDCAETVRQYVDLY